MTRVALILVLFGLLASASLAGEDWRPASTLVVANRAVPESEVVARHYMEQRDVSGVNLLLVDTVTQIGIIRKRYLQDIEKPIRSFLEERDSLSADRLQRDPPGILYIVLCYGVPTTIWEEGTEGGPPNERSRNNRAAVDSELSALLLREAPLDAFLRNPYFGLSLHPREADEFPVFLVTRLDGPTADMATALVDLARAGERFGIQGIGYFDVRGIKRGSYRAGDLWIEQAERAVRRAGYPTILDRAGDLMAPPGGFYRPAFYAGWYTANAYGPFLHGGIRFVPGAVGYHLYSGSAADIRSHGRYWVGPLLASGVTCTMGAVQEPFLSGTPQIGTFFERLLAGYDFAESAYMANPMLSWQITFIGDPLYRPFAPGLRAKQVEALKAERPAELRWLDVQAVNMLLEREQLAAALLLAEKLLGARPSALLATRYLSLLESDGRESQALALIDRIDAFTGPKEERARLFLAASRLLKRWKRQEASDVLLDRLTGEFPGTKAAQQAETALQSSEKGETSEQAPGKQSGEETP